jgi:abortive infection bacteriophage resistance protein
MEYQKPSLSLSDQVKLLISRGLIVPDHDFAETTLQNINYYRLSAYFLPFQPEKDVFRPGVEFKDILNLYAFDHHLRVLTFKNIETIEIGIRTRITYHLVTRYGAFAHIEPSHFAPSFKHVEWYASVKKEIARSKEPFVMHFREKYHKSADLPFWMLAETCSFGSMSLLFAGLKNEDKQTVAQQFHTHHSVFKSWVHMLVYLRNLCAHHARMWNREIAIRPQIPDSDADFSELRKIARHRMYTALSIAHYCLRIISCNHTLHTDLLNLFADMPHIPINRMGFPKDWNKHSIWIDKQ